MGNRLINPNYEFGVKISLDIKLNANSGLMDRLCSDYSKNPIFLCRVWVTLDINPDYGLMDMICIDEWKKIDESKNYDTC